MFYEQYDTEPVINIKDPAVVEPLKARMQAALAKLVTAFVLGATGFVGREVVRQLCVRGDARPCAHVRPDSSKLDDWRAKLGELGADGRHDRRGTSRRSRRAGASSRRRRSTC